MKKLILIILVVCLLPLASSGQNPVNRYKWIKTANDTIALGLSGYKTLTVKNCGTAANDTISVYIPDQYGVYGGYAFTIGRQVSKTFTYSGTGFIVKASSDSLMINYYTGAVEVGYDNSNQDSVKTYLSGSNINSLKFRDTVVYRDTLTSFKTYNFGSQYELITITVTKNDTCAVVWDSIKFYSVSTYGDTALIGVRYLETFTDSSLVRVNWTAGTRTSSKKVLLLDPILKILHIQLENYALTNRSVILTIRGAKK